MSATPESLPEDFPDYLKHSDADTPVPTWEQVTRSSQSFNEEMTAHVSRVVADSPDSQAAREVWEAWPGNYRRSVALIIDKVYNEGWLDLVGPIDRWPWDGGLFFRPRADAPGSVADALDSKAGRRGVYTESSWRNGLFAYLNSWSHEGWERSWMENDAGMAALHVGIFSTGIVELHLEAFNPLYTNGAPRSDVMRVPLVGKFNHRMFSLHRRWEQSEYGAVTRTSANFYHMMKGQNVPLSF